MLFTEEDINIYIETLETTHWRELDPNKAYDLFYNRWLSTKKKQ